MPERDQTAGNMELITAADGGGLLKIRGLLDFSTVPEMAAALPSMIADLRHLTVDLSGVNSANSAGLALMLELKRLASVSGGSVRFQNLSETLINIIRISELNDILDTSS